MTEDYKTLRYRVDETADVIAEVNKLLSLNKRAMVDTLSAMRDLALVIKTLQDRIEVLERK